MLIYIIERLIIEGSRDRVEKMTIKEAGRYANFLNSLRQELVYITNYGINSKLYSETENHKKSEAYKEHEDEVIEREFEDRVDVELEDLLKLHEEVIREKVNLACAIQEAKRDIVIDVDGLKLDVDSAIEYAKILREVSSGVYNGLKERKDSKRKSRGTGYAFNVEGNQTSYHYEVETVTKLLYSKEDIIKKDKDVRLLADRISQEVDKEMSKELVNHTSKYNYLDSAEDIIAEHVLLS